MGKIYILGGRTVGPNKRNNCSVFDPKTNKIKETAPLLIERESAASVVHEGRIVVSGGRHAAERKVEVYDHIAGKWSLMPDMIQGRHNHDSISIRNKIYMIGKYLINNMEVFDSLSNTFALVNSVLSNWKPAICYYVEFGDNIVVINIGSLDAAVFDVEKEEWSKVEDFKIVKSGGGASGNVVVPKY